MLLTPDVTVRERAGRERPEVAAAVLEQMHYGVVDPRHATANPLDGPAAVGDGRSTNGDRPAADEGGAPAETVGGDRR